MVHLRFTGAAVASGCVKIDSWVLGGLVEGCAGVEKRSDMVVVDGKGYRWCS